MASVADLGSACEMAGAPHMGLGTYLASVRILGADLGVAGAFCVVIGSVLASAA